MKATCAKYSSSPIAPATRTLSKVMSCTPRGVALRSCMVIPKGELARERQLNRLILLRIVLAVHTIGVAAWLTCALLTAALIVAALLVLAARLTLLMLLTALVLVLTGVLVLARLVFVSIGVIRVIGVITH